MENKKCIYTFIIGGYDNLKEPRIYTPGWDYICVTDNPNLKSETWDIIQIDEETKKIEPSKKRAMSLMIGYRKWLPKHYDIVVTIGGQCVINIDLDELLVKYGYDDSYDACLIDHPDRNCAYEEANTIVQVQRDTPERISNHVQMLINEGYPRNNGLYASGIMIINNNSNNIHKYYDQWLSDYLTYPSVRDQMTMNYSEWKLHKDTGINLNIKMLPFRKMFQYDRDIYTEDHQQSHAYAMATKPVLKNNISLLVGLLNNLDYNKHFYETTRELYPDIELCFVSYGSTDGTHEWLDSLNDSNVKYFYSTDRKTFSDTFNKATELATKDYVAYLHNDIVLAPNFIENLEKHVSLNNVVSYTTIEPPLFADHERPGKLIHDLGVSLETFSKRSLFEYVNTKHIEYVNKTEPGITFFMCMPRERLLEIGGLDNRFDPMFCEDDDLILRWKLLGMKCFTSLDAICYHFVSKTSRFSEEYVNKTREIEAKSVNEFIKKWGFRNSIYNVVYKKSIIINNSTAEFENVLNPWFTGGTDIIVEVDANTFTNNDFLLIQNLNDIIKDSGSIGQFKIGNILVTINSLNEYQKDLIKL